MKNTPVEIPDHLQPNKSVGLKNLRDPIAEELKTFRSYFKDALRTDVFLLNQMIRYLLRMKGKELRPILVISSARVCGEINESTYRAAAMVELLHTATLIHDDVVDEAETRRGFLTINKVWKNKAGVLLGDYLLSRGLLVALDADEFELLKVLSRAVKRMSEGELRQMKASKLQNMTEAKYYEIISGKTASLLSACCESGAVSTTDDQQKRDAMRDVGENIGMAFQIRDDLFDYGGEDVGKPVGNDIQERKMTLPLIAAFERGPDKTVREIRKLFRSKRKTSREVRQIVDFVHDYGGIEYSRKAMFEFAEKALESLHSFEKNTERDQFEELIRFIVNRRK